MQATIRKIGNSRGLIIPSSILDALQIDKEVEMVVKNKTLVIKPISSKLRQDWFVDYDASKDEEPLESVVDTEFDFAEWHK